MTLTLIQGGAEAAAACVRCTRAEADHREGPRMAGKADQAAKKALADWYGHSGACWTCNTPDGIRCEAGAELHDRFMAAVVAAIAEGRAELHKNGEVPLW